MAYIKTNWEDYPNTSTPITADDLNNIEDAVNQIGSFTTATVATGQPGKCYITMPGTLGEGDIININFPTAVNPSANAQFSIDGGATYYPISRPADAVQLIVSDVARKRVTLFFTGTAFLVISGTNLKGKSIVIRKNTTQSIPSQTQTKLTFQTADSGYDPNVFALVNNDIVIKSKMVKSVACTVCYQITSSLNTLTYLFKNTSQLAALGRAIADSGTMPGFVDNLALNDTINFRMWLVSAGAVSAAADWNYAIVTVLDTYE